MAIPTSLQALAQARFGLGARGDEDAPTDPKGSLLGQITSAPAQYPAFDATLDSKVIAARYIDERKLVMAADSDAKIAARQELRQAIQALYRFEVQARVEAALTTPAPFTERLVHFWANHFALSGEKPQVTGLAGAFEREAVRPHVLGRFEDMLMAVEQHPAMLFYLDQVRSIGPNSMRAQRAAANGNPRKLGINENLAREIIELHTLGVRTGYDQADVTQFALALSGWSVGGIGPDDSDAPGSFLFRPNVHEPGSRTIMGKTYGEDGEGQARAVLADLAASEKTAIHVATKLARHFIADQPPPAAVDALATAFMDSRGDLPTVYGVLIGRDEAWRTDAPKFKSPWDWTVSSLRALNWKSAGDLPVAQMLNQLGQPTWRPGAPAGYDDTTDAWAAPDALVRRVEVAQRLADRTPEGLDPRRLAARLLAGDPGGPTATQIERAESARTGLALLLVSPQFLRR